MIHNFELKDFPLTRFRGSKRKILPWIRDELSNLSYISVLDGFGGSSSVSFLFKKIGKSVTFNDYFKFNSLIAKAIIENDTIKIDDCELENFLERVSQSKKVGVVQKHFKGLYFTDEENVFIDNFIYTLKSFNFNRGPEYKRSLLLYALFQACLIKRPYNLFHRANLSLRLRDVKRSFGNKTSWDRPFEVYIKRFVLQANNIIFQNGKYCKSINKNIFDIQNTYDLVYLDPPYMDGRFSESADYMKCYHFLEGLAHYDDWEDMIDQDSKIKIIKRQYYNDGLLFTDMKDYIEKLFLRFSKSIIVLSYKGNGYPDIQTIRNLMSKYKENVRVSSVGYSYALSKSNNSNSEFLIIGY